MLLVLSLLTSASAGVVRHALIVGSNDGGSDLAPLQYAEQDAARIHLVLSELGGFSASHITVLDEPGRDELLAALEAHAIIAQDNEEDMFLFYYSGHATGRGLRLGEETLPYEELRQSINDLPSEVRLGVLDACRSGEITRLKGLTLSEPFATDDTLSAEGEAWLTASADDEDAQESDKLQGSFFTHYLVSGLRGAADQDDGVVSLQEAYEYAHAQTVSRTGRTDAGVQHPSYDFRIQGEGGLPLTDVRNASARVTLPEEMAGIMTVLRLPDEVPLVEVAKKQDVVTVIALPPGSYRLRLKDASGTWENDIGLDEGANQKVHRMSLVEKPIEMASLKGIGETGIDEEMVVEERVVDALPQAPPPLFYDPEAPSIYEDPGAAAEALGERAVANAAYQARRFSSWLDRRPPGSTTVVRTVPGEDATTSVEHDTWHYAGTCYDVGDGCLQSTAAAPQRDGTATISFPTGHIAAQGPLIGGIPDGEWTFYYESGLEHSTGRYSNGVTYGQWTWWYADGQKSKQGELQGEARVGTWLEWYESGKRKSRTEFSNGAQDGRSVEWYSSGQKKSEGRMIGERKDSEWTFFYEDGRKKSRGSYSDDGRTGTWTTWFSNGVKETKGRYAQDLKHGNWTAWWDTGTIFEEGSYYRGGKEGRWESWYINGIKHSSASYTDGEQDGRYTEWSERGDLQAKGRYNTGEAVGRWIRWDEDGIKQVERFGALSE